MKNKFLGLVFFFFCIVCFSQQKITWQDLSHIKFTKTYFPEQDDYFLSPEFLPPVKALDGKKITIIGFFLNLGVDQKVYILSKGPMASCYFCGQGGPETAMELQFKNPKNFKTDNIVSITGTLKLNQDDVEHFNYILVDCEGEYLK